jgi:hypothetical protein
VRGQPATGTGAAHAGCVSRGCGCGCARVGFLTRVCAGVVSGVASAGGDLIAFVGEDYVLKQVGASPLQLGLCVWPVNLAPSLGGRRIWHANITEVLQVTGADQEMLLRLAESMDQHSQKGDSQIARVYMHFFVMTDGTEFGGFDYFVRPTLLVVPWLRRVDPSQAAGVSASGLQQLAAPPPGGEVCTGLRLKRH